jgi:hypothetical protein
MPGLLPAEHAVTEDRSACASPNDSGSVLFSKENWISKDATLEASSIDPRWNRDEFMKKFLTGEPFDQHWGVCTKNEQDPWLMIDLKREVPVGGIDIVNRHPDCRDFARTLTLWISSDKKNWKPLWKAPQVEDRWTVEFKQAQTGRYIKLGLREKQYLNLKHVFVYQADKDQSVAESEVPVRHRFIATDIRNNRVMLIDENNNVEWSHPFRIPTDVHRLENGNVLVAGIREAAEIQPDGKVVWKYSNPGDLFSAVPLANGNRLIGCSGEFRVIEIDPKDDSVVREFSTKSKGTSGHMHSRHIRTCRNGDTLVALIAESRVNRYSQNGRLYKSYDIRSLAEQCGLENTGKHQAYSAEELPNGHTLICSGFPAMVVEVDPAGSVVWSVTPKEVPSVNFMFAGGAKRLANGNTVICNWTNHNFAGDYIPVFEVTPEKKVVWSFTDKEIIPEPLGIQILK